MTEDGPAARCLWCEQPFSKADLERGKLYCNASHRQRYKRANRAATLGDLVEKLGPHVDIGGIDIYKELVDHLAGTIRSGEA